MFSKVKGKEKKTLTDLLMFIVAGTQSAAGHSLVPLTLAKSIIKAEPTFIKLQSETADPAGNVPAFATSLGIAAAGAPAAPATEPGPKPVFKIDMGIPVPASKRGGGLKADIYPFATLPVGGSFFVAATEANPNPVKGLASTVSSANKRFKAVYPLTVGRDKKAHPKAGQPTGKEDRSFTVRARTAEDEPESKQAGARVWRTA